MLPPAVLTHRHVGNGGAVALSLGLCKMQQLQTGRGNIGDKFGALAVVRAGLTRVYKHGELLAEIR
jgi:hypothetical protein